MSAKTIKLSDMENLIPPVKIADFFHLSIILLILGFFVSCWFLLYDNYI